jgi:hypothetical protein
MTAETLQEIPIRHLIFRTANERKSEREREREKERDTERGKEGERKIEGEGGEEKVIYLFLYNTYLYLRMLYGNIT